MLLIRFVFGVPLYENLLSQIESLLPLVLLSLAGYFAVLYALDRKFRKALMRLLSSIPFKPFKNSGV
jgi:hypothetical protein